jgi:hypothetical protein
MNRDYLPRNSGMVFLYPVDTEGAFWMNGTKIPLSIAFFDLNGRIICVTNMEPYSLESHSPGVPFRGLWK